MRRIKINRSYKLSLHIIKIILKKIIVFVDNIYLLHIISNLFLKKILKHKSLSSTKPFIALFISILLFTSNPLKAQITEGPNFPGTGSNVTGIGSVAWTNTGNITATANYAQVTLNNNISNYLQGSDFGFTIPTNGTIIGIEVTIGKLRESGPGNTMYDQVVRLVKNGTITGSNYAQTTTNWTRDQGTPADVVYGGSTDLWGTTWTPADINNANFGVVIAATTTLNIYARVDYMIVSVYYSSPGSYTTPGTTNFNVPTGGMITG